MGKRERIEDLGFILGKCEQTLDMELFGLYSGREKDFLDWIEELTPERKEEFLHQLPYRISDLREAILEIWSIASGTYADE